MSKQINKQDSEKTLKDFLSPKKPVSDDFERDALQGFDTLSNENEALNLKADLDSRISEKLFVNRKKTSRVAWFAAASLLLIVGLSVYFLLNSVKTKDLAVTETQSEQKMTELNPPKGILEPASSNENKMGAGISDKNSDVQNSNGTQAASGAAGGPTKPNKLKTNADSQKSPATKVDADAKKETELEIDYRENVINELDVREEIIAPPLPSTEKNKRSDRASNSKNVKKDSKASSPNTFSAPPSIQADVTYPGGYEGLRLHLKEILIQKEINERFDATLYINKKGKVEKVVFTKVYELSELQQKKIITILKSIKDFQYNATGGLIEYPVSYIN